MISNLEKYKKDLEQLIFNGWQLLSAMNLECHPNKFEEALKKSIKTKKEIDEIKKDIPFFNDKYQTWYSESLAIVKFLLPDRVQDFIKLYEKPKGRKDIAYGNYVIEDYLQNLQVTTALGDVKVAPYAAIPQFQQQLNILKSVKQRFESSLFDIKQLVQADLFDSELESAKELNKKGFSRGAGAIAGVVLEKHLSQVCDNHNVKITKNNPTINDFNQYFKNTDIIEIKDWRFIQRLADLRNLCDHNKKTEPKQEDIKELITGVEKVSKTIF